jgi:hypothetical protein
MPSLAWPRSGTYSILADGNASEAVNGDLGQRAAPPRRSPASAPRRAPRPRTCGPPGARSARPASVTLSRTASPAISAPAFPAALVPGNYAGRADTRGCTLGSAAHVNPETRRRRCPSVAVRGSRRSRRPSWRHGRPSAICPWMPQHAGPQRPARPRIRSTATAVACRGQPRR